MIGIPGTSIGVDAHAGFTWVIVGALVVTLALIVSTRRARPRAGFTAIVPPSPRERGALARAASRVPNVATPAHDAGPSTTHDFAAAQALFVDDPRSSVEFAQAIVVRVLAANAAGSALPPAVMARYRDACASVADPAATIDQLRRALLDFRAVLDASG